MATQLATQFDRGGLGQIMPPPLVDGMTPDELLVWFRNVTPGVDTLIEGFGADGVMALAIAAYTRQRMIALFDGEEQPRTDDERALVQAAEAGEAISLVPVGLEELGMAGPALVKHGTTWEVGHAGRQMGACESAKAAIATLTHPLRPAARRRFAADTPLKGVLRASAGRVSWAQAEG